MKKILVFLFAVFVVIGLAGCGSIAPVDTTPNTPIDTPTDTTPPEEPTVGTASVAAAVSASDASMYQSDVAGTIDLTAPLTGVSAVVYTITNDNRKDIIFTSLGDITEDGQVNIALNIAQNSILAYSIGDNSGANMALPLSLNTGSIVGIEISSGKEVIASWETSDVQFDSDDLYVAPATTA